MSNLIPCRSCNGAISRRARVCSHCGVPLKGTFLRFCRINVIVIAFLYVSLHDQMHAYVEIPGPLEGLHKWLDQKILGLQSAKAEQNDTSIEEGVKASD